MWHGLSSVKRLGPSANGSTMMYMDSMGHMLTTCSHASVFGPKNVLEKRCGALLMCETCSTIPGFRLVNRPLRTETSLVVHMVASTG